MFRSITFIVCALFSCRVLAVVADLEDKSLPVNSFYNGSDAAKGFVSRDVHFFNSYDPTFGWSGFSYSNVNDTTTAGFGNQYAAITGSGFGGSGIYAVMSDFGIFAEPNTIMLPYTAAIQSLRITNSTYAYLAVRDGNDGFGIVRQFGDDPNMAGSGNQGFSDWFKVTITGKDAGGQTTGSLDYYLADYRFASNGDDYVVNTWQAVDLSSLGNVKSLSFSLSSSDVGMFGMNTPAYLALDDVTFVPDPQMAIMVVLSLGLLLRR